MKKFLNGFGPLVVALVVIAQHVHAADCNLIRSQKGFYPSQPLKISLSPQDRNRLLRIYFLDQFLNGRGSVTHQVHCRVAYSTLIKKKVRFSKKLNVIP